MFAINKKKKKTQIQKRTKILLFTLIAFLTAAVIIFGLFFTNIFPGINNQENNNQNNQYINPNNPNRPNNNQYSGNQNNQPSAYNNQIIVKFKPGYTKDNIPELKNARLVNEIPELGVKVFQIDNPEEITRILNNHPFIEYAELDAQMTLQRVPNDPQYKVYQSTAARDLNLAGAWDIVTASGFKVAVIDSGIMNFQHDDLPVIAERWNIITGTSNTTPILGHGSQVAGVVGMIGNNSLGGAGINWKANIMDIRIDDSTGNISVSNCASAITYAANNGAKVINMSWGNSDASPPSALTSAVSYAYSQGAVLIAASGNSGKTPPDNPCRSTNVLCVGSFDGIGRDTISNYGTGLDVLAAGSFYTVSKNSSSSYGNFAGTSAASPQVAGLATLMLGLNPNLTNAQIYQLIKDNARDLTQADNPAYSVGWDSQTGWGLVNMGNTLQAVLNLKTSNTFSVTGISPSSGLIAGGQNVTITGTGFRSGLIIHIDGLTCTSLNIISATNATCVTPSRYSLGTYNVFGVIGQEVQMLPNGYNYVANISIPTPTISGVVPSSGSVLGGDSITITGTDLSTTSSIKIDGNPCSSITINSNTSVSCITPPASTGSGSATKDITLTTDGGSTTSYGSFTYVDIGEPPLPPNTDMASADISLYIEPVVAFSLNNCPTATDMDESTLTLPISTPNMAGTFVSNCQIASIDTNAPGYSLTIRARSSDDSNNLILQRPTAITPTPKISSTSNPVTAPNQLLNNTWGFAVTSLGPNGVTLSSPFTNFTSNYTNLNDNTNKYASLPNMDMTVYQTNTKPSQTNQFNFYYATNITSATYAGQYQTAIVYSVVGNI